MKYLRIAFLAGFAASVLHAGDVKVIANPSVGVANINSDDLKRVFLATKSSLADGSHVEPVLAKGGAAHEAFLKEYLGKTDAALTTYYRSLVFTGKGSIPRSFGSTSDTISLPPIVSWVSDYCSASVG